MREHDKSNLPQNLRTIKSDLMDAVDRKAIIKAKNKRTAKVAIVSLLTATALTGTAIAGGHAAGILGDGTSSIPTSQFHGKSSAEIRSLLEANGMSNCSPEVVSGLSDMPAKFMGVYMAGCGPASSEEFDDGPNDDHESPQPVLPTKVAPTKSTP